MPDDIGNMMSQFGLSVKTLRKVQKLSQERLAEKANVSPDTIKRIEAASGGCGLETAIMIARVFNTTLDSLLFGQASLPPCSAEDMKLIHKYAKSICDILKEKSSN